MATAGGRPEPDRQERIAWLAKNASRVRSIDPTMCQHLSICLTVAGHLVILKSMLNSPVGNCFRALAEPVRMAIIERLSRGPATLSEVAQPFDLTLAAVVQHVQVLEQCGLIKSEKIGRTRTCQVDPRGLDVVSNWIPQRRSMVEQELDRLGEMLTSEDREHASESSHAKRRTYAKRKTRRAT